MPKTWSPWEAQSAKLQSDLRVTRSATDTGVCGADQAFSIVYAGTRQANPSVNFVDGAEGIDGESRRRSQLVQKVDTHLRLMSAGVGEGNAHPHFGPGEFSWREPATRPACLSCASRRTARLHRPSTEEQTRSFATRHLGQFPFGAPLPRRRARKP